MYLSREIDKQLESWRTSNFEKPLLIRGARQVGKSTSIRHLGNKFDHYVELNFEARGDLHQLFEGNLDPKAICENISLIFNTPIIPGKTLLFFDEIQACIPAISSLRFFYEQYPELHLIAAGSLLEFALSEIPSFGVGRIRSMFVYPLSFDEFLNAMGEEHLLDAKRKSSATKPLTDPVHQKLIDYLKRFLILGGMPEVVKQYAQDGDLLECGRILDDLVVSIQTDFAKYKNRVPSLRINQVFASVANQVGNKFVYSKVQSDSNHKHIQEALQLLILAGLVIPVTHSSGNGLPIGAQINPKKRKMILLDSGIYQRIMGLKISELLLASDLNLLNKGAVSEQYCGLEILKAYSSYYHESLYYWHREARNSNAEVDYLVQKGNDIIPIEIKSGTKGSMQSMYLFLKEKKSKYGVRFSSEKHGNLQSIQIWPLYAVSDFIKSQ